MGSTPTARPLSLLLALTIVIATIFAGGVATATESLPALTDDTVTAAEVAATLDTMQGSAVAEPVESTQTATAAAVAEVGDITVEVPKAPDEPVSLADGETEVMVTVPNADEAGTAVRTADGAVVYPSSDGSATAVIPNAAGVQMLTIIANRDAPTRYTYDVDVPAGSRVELRDEGAAVVDESGEVTVLVPKPWAKDYVPDPQAVPTHFETDGATLTQIVEHTAGDYNYPLQADPFWIVAAVANAVRAAAYGCVAGAVGSMGWEAMKWGIRRGEWSWRNRLNGAIDACLQMAVFGGAGRFLSWGQKQWLITTVRPQVVNYILWSLR